MIKYIKFYATEEDMKVIADIADSIFEKLVEVPGLKKDVLKPRPEELKDIKICLYAEESRVKDVIYRTSEMYDGTILEPIDPVASPILEYPIVGIPKDGLFLEQQFYSCSCDLDFQKKVSKFFAKVKKEFIYVRKYRVYVSPNIDLSTAKFDNDRIITEEDLTKK